MSNTKYYFLIASIYIVGVIAIFCFISSLRVRENMLDYKQWKETYESGYCPTCGHKLDN